jgi:hypothetical protein
LHALFYSARQVLTRQGQTKLHRELRSAIAKLTLVTSPPSDAAEATANPEMASAAKGGAATGTSNGESSDFSVSQAALSAWREVLGLPKDMPEVIPQPPRPTVAPPQPPTPVVSRITVKARVPNAKAKPSQALLNPKAAAAVNDTTGGSGGGGSEVPAAIAALSNLCLSANNNAGSGGSNSGRKSNSGSGGSKGKGKGNGKTDAGSLPGHLASRLGPVVGTSGSAVTSAAEAVGTGSNQDLDAKGKAEGKGNSGKLRRGKGKGGKGKGGSKKNDKGKGGSDGKGKGGGDV